MEALSADEGEEDADFLDDVRAAQGGAGGGRRKKGKSKRGDARAEGGKRSKSFTAADAPRGGGAAPRRGAVAAPSGDARRGCVILQQLGW